jgi:glyoxylase-like metal-dependent hydrolase (beta-lactamase superfamily II)
MNRIPFVLLCCLALGWGAQEALAQHRLDRVVIRPQKLADGVWMLTGAGGNVAVCVGPEGVLLVDAQYGRVAPRILATVDSLSGGRLPRFVLNTHYHRDHVGGDSAMAAAGATVFAHSNVRTRMATNWFNETFDAEMPSAPTGALPVVTFSDTLTFHLGGREIRAFHLPPGHTDGDVVVHMPSADVVHTGDLLFNGFYPVIDVSAGGSIGGMVRSIDRVLPLIGPETRIIPGHGPLADRAALLRFREMLVTARDRIRELVGQGKTLDEILAAAPLADLDAIWGRGFMKPERFLRTLVEDLSRSGTGGKASD